ncbi:hypothetical protein Lauda_00131 [Pseudomonas phage vB_PpuM-Lauda]
MDTALLAKVQRAFIRRGLLHDDYEPGVWDAPTTRAYVAYMRSKSVQRYPKQINLNDVLLVKEIISVLSMKKGGAVDAQDDQLIVATNVDLTGRDVQRGPADSTWVDALAVADAPEPTQDSAGDTITPLDVSAVEETPETPPIASGEATTKDRLLAIMGLLSKR